MNELETTKTAIKLHLGELIESNTHSSNKMIFGFGQTSDVFYNTSGIKKIIPKQYWKSANILGPELSEFVDTLRKETRRSLKIYKQRKYDIPPGFYTEPYKVLNTDIKIVKR